MRTSHSQQSLQRRQRAQRWLSQASFVQYTQISVDGSLQMLHWKTLPSLIGCLSDCAVWCCFAAESRHGSAALRR
jgi:hypothetical protein